MKDKPDGLKHYGIPQRSGRYPWGSGDDPYQRNKSFIGYVDDLKKQGLSPVEIAKGMGMTTTQLRAKSSLAKAELRKADSALALRLKEKGMSNVAIGERMGRNESSVRALLNPALQERSEITQTISNMLKDNVEKKGYIDVGIGVERHIGISRTKLRTAMAQLEEEGYKVWYVPVEQLGTGKKTTILTLAKPDSEYKDVFKNKDKIKTITDYTEDGGRSILGLEPVRSVDSKRIKIRYGDEGGSDKDGVIELRRGVDDLNLGNARYAQVRVAVDDVHYMKGMAIYNDNMPKGVDVIYNTNKASGTSQDKVFKEMKKDNTGKVDQDNPFGSTVRQNHYTDASGKKQLSSLNVVYEEGEWSEWSKTLSSQMLSKQSPALAKKQLEIAFNEKREEFNEINALTNPVVKKKLLNSLADDCDSSAVHLKSAALPRQGSHAILPFSSIKENEVYAPNYRDGEQVVLIRYPHGGIFEIPQLKVNNRNAEANKLIKQAKDAIGINPKVAAQLSGADFDGDTVLVIPNPKGLIKTSAPLKGLQDFDPKISYKPYDGMPTIDGGIYNEKTGKVDYGGKKPRTQTKQVQMGNVSNLITDMTIGAATPSEIARAVRHSMCVIDAEKHHLNYKQSAIENGIAQLKKKYQGGERAGAATLISRSSSEKRVDFREDGEKRLNPETGKIRRVYVDPDTGKKLYNYTGETYTNKKGKLITRTVKSTKMAEADDAFSLSSGTPIETVYATHANKLKALGNDARKVAINTANPTYSPSAKKVYAKEVASLQAQLNVALKNAPLERQAQLLANKVVSTKKDQNPHMDAADLKKIKGQALAEARTRTQAKKTKVDISDREWEAIQSRAVSANVLKQILDNADPSRIKQLATPRSSAALTPAQETKIKRLLKAGKTQAEVADAMGVSTSVVARIHE